jgi:hypothetical protein
MQGDHVLAFHPVQVKPGRPSNWSQRHATPVGIQPTRDFKANLGARRMEKVEVLLAQTDYRMDN